MLERQGKGGGKAGKSEVRKGGASEGHCLRLSERSHRGGPIEDRGRVQVR